MNREERRRLERGGHKPERPATKKDAERFIDEAFQDRISWTAARVLLERVVDDPAFDELAPEVRVSIDRFLERHPKPTPRS